MAKSKSFFKKCTLMGLMVVMSLSTKAQTITGCVPYSPIGNPLLNRPIYTSSTGIALAVCNGATATLYGSSPAIGPLNTLCYSPAIPAVSSGTPRNCAIITIVGGSGVYECGIIRTITIVNCPLDNYVAYLLLSLSAAGVFFIRKGLSPIPSKLLGIGSGLKK